MVTGGAEARDHRADRRGVLQHEGALHPERSPETASRPFDKDRDGFVLGDGGAVVVLESLEHAQKPRRAHPGRSRSATASSADAYHITSPAPDGEGAQRAMRRLPGRRQHRSASDVGYINAHGTSTPAGRHRRDRGGEGGLRRRRRAKLDLRLHQVDDRPPARCGAGALEFGVSLLVARPAASSRRPSTSSPPIPSAISTPPPITRSSARWTWRCRNSFGFGGHNVTLAVRAGRTRDFTTASERGGGDVDFPYRYRQSPRRYDVRRARLRRLQTPRSSPSPGRSRPGERLAAADGVTLYSTPRSPRPRMRWPTPPIAALNGDRVFFSANQHINPTNVCILRNTCVFCSFARMPKEEGAYTRSLEEVFHEAEQARGMPTREFHIVGGLHPKLRLSYYADMIRGLKERHPARTHQGAHRGRDRPPRRASRRCPSASAPGAPRGGAHQPARRRRRGVQHGGPRHHRRAEAHRRGMARVHRVAHELGIPTNCTMLYGHVETAADRIEHLGRAARRCRTRRADSSPTSRSRITPTTTSWAKSWAASAPRPPDTRI